MKRVVVHVGKLVVHGLPADQTRGIGAAVERAVAGRLGGPIGKAVRGPVETAIDSPLGKASGGGTPRP